MDVNQSGSGQQLLNKLLNQSSHPNKQNELNADSSDPNAGRGEGAKGTSNIDNTGKSGLTRTQVQEQIQELKEDIKHQGLDRVTLSQQVFANQPEWRKGLPSAIGFLKSFIEIESQEGDIEGAKTLNSALSALEKVDLPVTPKSRAQEIEGQRFVRDYVELLHETEAPAGITANFEHLLGVFNALDQSRLQELQTNATASYATVQQILNRNGYE